MSVKREEKFSSSTNKKIRTNNSHLIMLMEKSLNKKIFMKTAPIEQLKVFQKDIMELFLHMAKLELEKHLPCKDQKMMRIKESFPELSNIFLTRFMEQIIWNFSFHVVCWNYIMNKYLICWPIKMKNWIFMKSQMKGFMLRVCQCMI